MNKSSKQKEVIFAVLVGILLAGALWFTIGQWVGFSMCQSTPTPQCTEQTSNIVAIISVILGAVIATINVKRVLKNKA